MTTVPTLPRLVPLVLGLCVTIQPCVAADASPEAGPDAGAGPAGRFAVVSDIHFDPFDPPALAGALLDATPGDWDTVFAQIDRQSASSYGTDTNYALLKSTLAAFGKAARDVDFVVAPGDFLTHSFERKAAEALGVDRDDPAVATLAVKTTLYLADALDKAVPDTPLILALGNNDSACGDYKVEPGGPYLAATGAALKTVLDADALEPDFETTFANGGYYAVRHPTVKNAVVLVVNDTLWSARYADTCATGGTDSAAAEMLDWLEGRLASARDTGEMVWLVRHIPAGFDAYATSRATAASCPQKPVPLLRDPYRHRMMALLRSYAGTIRTSLAGHIHHDDVRIVADAHGTVVGYDKVAPAISPEQGQNPGFQIFSYDADSGVPTDIETWYLANLPETSLSTAGDWRREYRFTEAYGLPDLSPASIAALWTDIREPGPAQQTFARYYFVEHAPMPDAELPAVICAARYSDLTGFTGCFCGR